MLIGAIFIAMLMMICINIPIAVALAMCGVLGLLLARAAARDGGSAAQQPQQRG